MDRTLLLLVQFDGTDLHGWQQQAGDRTVQGLLRDALAQMLGHDVNLRASSRTDAGVHALALPVSFRTPRTIPCHGILRGLNSMLPDEVSVVSARDVPESFDARDRSRGKEYRYDIWNADFRSALRARYAWWVRGGELDVAAMRAGAAHLVGEHDFRSFRASGCDAKTTSRRLTRVDVATPEPHLVRVTVEGNAFLRNMVRILVGTLVDVGRGRMPPAAVGEVLAACDRTVAGPTAPPQGLTLVRVLYAPADLGLSETPPDREAPAF